MLAIAWNNLKHRKIHTWLLVISVAVATAVLSTCAVLADGVERALEASIQRMGADILVSPASGDLNTSEQILFSGQPVNLYMDKSLVEQIANIPGVKQVSGEFFTQTLNASCCSVAGADRIVGIDPRSDFVLKPWLRSHGQINGELKTDQMIVGGRILMPLGGKAYVLGRLFEVTGQLPVLGGGIDTSLFIPIDQARSLAAASPALQRYWINGQQPDQLVSAVLIRVKDSAQISTTLNRIRELDGVRAVAASEVLQSSQKQFSLLVKSLKLVLGSLWLLVLLGLATRYALYAAERKREFGLLRALGARRIDIFANLLYEALLTCLGGGMIGLAAASFFVYKGSEILIHQSNYPFVLPPVESLARLGFYLLLLALTTGLLASLVPAWHCAGLDPVQAISQGELE